MDPDANLKEQIDLAMRIARGDCNAEDSERLAELVSALDGWLRNGGFLPKVWAGKNAQHTGRADRDYVGPNAVKRGGP